MARNKRITLVKEIVFLIFMILCSVLFLYPILYMVFGATLTKSEFLEAGILPLPKSFSTSRFKNFGKIFMADGLWQSLFVTFARIAFYAFCNIFISTMGGYIFARVRFRGRNIVFMIYMSTMMIPGIATMVPNYIILAKFPTIGSMGIGLIDNPLVLFVTGWVSVYNIFLMRQAIEGIGGELDEAAQMDGAGRFYIVFKIYLPLALPVISVMMIGLFMGMWNDYTTSLIYLPSHSEWHTIGTKIIELLNDGAIVGYDTYPDYPAIYGVSVAFILPPVAVFLIFQKQIIGGLTMGAVKG